MNNFAPKDNERQISDFRPQTADFAPQTPDTRPEISALGTQHSALGTQPIARCFIQAGGRSTRMGKDKAWLLLNGRPLIEHSLAAAFAVSPRVALIIDATNQQQDRYRQLAAQWKAEIITDLFHHRGPLGGIYTALTQCPAQEAALILACDLPFITPEFLGWLWQVHHASAAALTVPLDQRSRVQMLAGVYAATCREPIARMLSWDELMTDRLRLRISTRLVTFSEYAHLPGAAQMLVNINTAEDYQRLAVGLTAGN